MEDLYCLVHTETLTVLLVGTYKEVETLKDKLLDIEAQKIIDRGRLEGEEYDLQGIQDILIDEFRILYAKDCKEEN